MFRLPTIGRKLKCRWFSWDKSSFRGTISYLSIGAQWLANELAPPTFSYFIFNRAIRGKSNKISCLWTTACAGKSGEFPALFAFFLLVDQIVFYYCKETPVSMHWPSLSLRWSVCLFWVANFLKFGKLLLSFGNEKARTCIFKGVAS